MSDREKLIEGVTRHLNKMDIEQLRTILIVVCAFVDQNAQGEQPE